MSKRIKNEKNEKNEKNDIMEYESFESQIIGIDDDNNSLYGNEVYERKKDIRPIDIMYLLAIDGMKQPKVSKRDKVFYSVYGQDKELMSLMKDDLINTKNVDDEYRNKNFKLITEMARIEQQNQKDANIVQKIIRKIKG